MLQRALQLRLLSPPPRPGWDYILHLFMCQLRSGAWQIAQPAHSRTKPGPAITKLSLSGRDGGLAGAGVPTLPNQAHFGQTSNIVWNYRSGYYFLILIRTSPRVAAAGRCPSLPLAACYHSPDSICSSLTRAPPPATGSSWGDNAIKLRLVAQSQGRRRDAAAGPRIVLVMEWYIAMCGRCQARDGPRSFAHNFMGNGLQSRREMDCGSLLQIIITFKQER